MMYGRDESAPTPTVCADIMHWINLVVCLLDYEWCTGEINLPLRLRCVRWYTFMQWINLVFAVCWIMNDCRARWICPYAYSVFAVIHFTQWINLVVCLLDYEWCTGEINLSLRLRDVRCYTFMQWIDPVECPLIYIYALNRPCGMSVDIHFK